MELSVNGEPFQVRALSDVPEAESFGDLVLGDRGGKPRGLLDEVLAFRRPLTLEEVRLLWKLGTTRAGEQEKGSAGEQASGTATEQARR